MVAVIDAYTGEAEADDSEPEYVPSATDFRVIFCPVDEELLVPIFGRRAVFSRIEVVYDVMYGSLPRGMVLMNNETYWVVGDGELVESDRWGRRFTSGRKMVPIPKNRNFEMRS